MAPDLLQTGRKKLDRERERAVGMPWDRLLALGYGMSGFPVNTFLQVSCNKIWRGTGIG